MSQTPHSRTAHLAVYDGLADWEIGHLTAYLRKNDCEVVTVAEQAGIITTMGGLRLVPDLTLAELPDPAEKSSDLLIIPGASDWESVIPPFARLARKYLDAEVPVAAICGATAALASEGLLDDRAHTSAVAPFLAMTGYAGGAHYEEVDAVSDAGVVTAGPTEPVAFAREVLSQLNLLQPDVLDAWFRLYQHSDTTAYELASAAEGPQR